GQGQAVAVVAGVLAAIGAHPAHAQAAADATVEGGVGEVAAGVVETQVQDVARLVQRREHAAQVDLPGAVAVVGGVAGILGEQAERAVQGVSGGAGDLDAHAAVVAVGPVHQVIGSGALLGGHPLGAGGLLQAELGVEAADLDGYRGEAVVGQRDLVEVVVLVAVVATGVAREVVVDLVGPVAVQHAAQLEEGPPEVAGVGAVAVLGVEAVEAAVVGLDATAELEAEGLVGGAYLQASLGLDHDVGAVGGDGA